MAELTVGYVSGIIAAGVFLGEYLMPFTLAEGQAILTE